MNDSFSYGDFPPPATGDRTTDRNCLIRAITLAATSSGSGGFPNGALVVLAGDVLGEGLSNSQVTSDPTAHAEVAAIRAAAAKIGAGRLPGATLYTTLEPCLMCLHSAYWAGIERIVFGAGKNLLRPVYYEGCGNLKDAARALNRWITIEHLAGFEERIVALVSEWEGRQGD